MVAGIVCEYNPFHNGHNYHINETKKTADFVVCVMSGNFVQRGDCAFLDKWTRAKLAVLHGADLVIDLPVPWSNASAETFARGSIGLLGAFGVDMISFGSETDDLNLLKKCADIHYEPTVIATAKELMAQGETYPTALCKAAEKLYGKTLADILNTANNTLATEYIKAAKNLGFSFDFLPVKRYGAQHDSNKISSNTASASKIRNMGICEETRQVVSETTYETLLSLQKEGFAPYSLINCERAILSCLREIKKEDYTRYISDTQGLANRIYESARTAESLQMLYENAKSKNYTLSRIRREIISLYLRIEKDLSEGIPPYIRVLASSEKGISLLGKAKCTSTLPIVTKHGETLNFCGKAKKVYDVQCSSTDKFALCGKKIKECGLEQKNSMIIVK